MRNAIINSFALWCMLFVAVAFFSCAKASDDWSSHTGPNFSTTMGVFGRINGQPFDFTGDLYYTFNYTSRITSFYCADDFRWGSFSFSTLDSFRGHSPTDGVNWLDSADITIDFYSGLTYRGKILVTFNPIGDTLLPGWSAGNLSGILTDNKGGSDTLSDAYFQGQDVLNN